MISIGDTCLQVRVDERTKVGAENVFKQLGMTTSSAVRLFLNQVILTKTIPFSLVTKASVSEERAIGRGLREVKTGKVLELNSKADLEDYLESV